MVRLTFETNRACSLHLRRTISAYISCHSTSDVMSTRRDAQNRFHAVVEVLASFALANSIYFGLPSGQQRCGRGLRRTLHTRFLVHTAQ